MDQRGSGNPSPPACLSVRTFLLWPARRRRFASPVAGVSEARESFSEPRMPAGPGSSRSCRQVLDTSSTWRAPPPKTAKRVERAPSSASGVALGTANGGASWRAQPLPAGMGPLSGFSCPSTTVCYASAVSTQQSGMLLKFSCSRSRSVPHEQRVGLWEGHHRNRRHLSLRSPTDRDAAGCSRLWPGIIECLDRFGRACRSRSFLTWCAPGARSASAGSRLRSGDSSIVRTWTSCGAPSSSTPTRRNAVPAISPVSWQRSTG